ERVGARDVREADVAAAGEAVVPVREHDARPVALAAQDLWRGVGARVVDDGNIEQPFVVRAARRGERAADGVRRVIGDDDRGYRLGRWLCHVIPSIEKTPG